MSVSKKLKIFLKNTHLMSIKNCVSNSTGGNKIKLIGKRNIVSKSYCILKNTKITINGSNNRIIFGMGARLQNCSVIIAGDNNTVNIGDKCDLHFCSFAAEDNNNIIDFARKITVHGNTQIDCIEGCKVTVGEDCMFSSDIQIRTGDSHSIVDRMGVRINNSKDVVIGKHVWIGTKCIINKGSVLSDNSIVGSGAIVTKAFLESNIIVAGNPAKTIKCDINWLRERI